MVPQIGGWAEICSKDTTQSVYRCAFTDCGHEMHADENAAINIGRKWIDEKLITVKPEY